ncbi:hypothetical protein [uncultured Traorella sp.]|uniref:hypothetical protein n=1 Tax=uncultured Traorella sp. TaxID=1929048 RepID=UPI0025FF40B9|nr:hypothetical protein [uncultured Traorella sp.]
MNKKTSWKDKYLLSISETLSLKDIEKLCDVGSSKASDIRKQALDYCILNDIPIYTRYVPTEAVLAIINHDIEYYYNRMCLENRAVLVEVV